MEVGVHQLVELIPVDRITVINPRVRNKKVFKDIVANIAQVDQNGAVVSLRRNDLAGRHAFDLPFGRFDQFAD